MYPIMRRDRRGDGQRASRGVAWRPRPTADRATQPDSKPENGYHRPTTSLAREGAATSTRPGADLRDRPPTGRAAW